MEEDQVSQQALHWLIMLKDRPDDRDIHIKFDAWLAQSDAHEAAWGEAQRTWSAIGRTFPLHTDQWHRQSTLSSPVEAVSLPAEIPADDSFQQAPTTAPTTSATTPTRASRRKVLIAAAVGFAACLVLALPTVRLWWIADFHTGAGETSRVALKDGSILHLSADSAARIAYEQDRRQVTLLKGEAFFEVAPDSARPFRVEADEWTTTVRGTAFDVVLDKRGASIAVEHGTVVVGSHAPAPFGDRTLGPGDWVRLERQRGVVASGRAQASQAGAWRNGWMVVKSRSVADVTNDLRRYHRGFILLTDQRLGSRLVSGVYDLRHPEEALRAVVQPHSAVVRQVTPYLLVVSSS